MEIKEAIVCEHGHKHCRWCDEQKYDDTCWMCAREMRVPGVMAGGKPVHRRCKARAEKYLSDTM